MKIAIASGKGGTGKTTVAVNLAQVCEGPVRLLDCDVEEPNAHIFMKPAIDQQESVTVPVPRIDAVLCDACGECGRFCQFNAIVSLKTLPLVFPELCHSCGGCAKVCPRDAITEEPREIGIVERGKSDSIEFIQGILNVGESMSPPLIRAVKRYADGDGVTLLDCPPGTSCPVVTAVRGCDYVLLVTEPTPFGLHDLILAIETFRQVGVPFGVVVNRSDIGDGRVTDYCRDEGIPILLQIPNDRRVAEAYSRGQTAVDSIPEMAEAFRSLLCAIERQLCVTTGNQQGVCHAKV